MNILQRIVLLIGAAALLIMIYLAGLGPRDVLRGLPYEPNMSDWVGALVRGAIISTATVAVYFAVGKKK
jgi:hypothetical protein